MLQYVCCCFTFSKFNFMVIWYLISHNIKKYLPSILFTFFFFYFRFPNYWVPKLKPTIVYSEILNQYMKVTVTERTLKLIDEHYGFDHYILAVSCF